jgi:hypothetical protein
MDVPIVLFAVLAPDSTPMFFSSGKKAVLDLVAAVDVG